MSLLFKISVGALRPGASIAVSDYFSEPGNFFKEKLA
jgi:hypothetical protein